MGLKHVAESHERSDRLKQGWAPVQESSTGAVHPKVAEAAYREYSRLYGTDQSLSRMNQRGGFGWSELVEFLYSQIEKTDV